MSKEYDGKFEDIIIGIPSNAVELNIEVTTYENGKLERVNGKYNLNDIEEAKKHLKNVVMENIQHMF